MQRKTRFAEGVGGRTSAREGADSRLRLSETFDDRVKLLTAAEKMGLEGLVSKRRDAPYRAGTMCGWIKVKI